MSKWLKKTAKAASSQASKKYVKTVAAATAATPEEANVLQAFERLKLTKQEVGDLAKAARAMVDESEERARHYMAFGAAAAAVKLEGANPDQFALMSLQMGQGFRFIANSLQESVALLSEKIVAPMEKFLSEDVEAVNKLKWDYTALKPTYDSAFHKAKKAKETTSTMPAKQAMLDQTAFAKRAELDAMRSDLIAKVSALELTKQRVLFLNMDAFWTRYKGICAHRSTTMAELIVPGVAALPPAEDDVERLGADFCMRLGGGRAPGTGSGLGAILI